MRYIIEPGQVIELVETLLCDLWPACDEEAVAFLQGRGCEVLGAQGRERAGRWHCPALDVWGTWNSCPPSGTQVNFFLLDTRATDPISVPRYVPLVVAFTDRFGIPHLVDRNPLSPHTQWCRKNLTVSLHLYSREFRRPLIEVRIEPV